DPGVFASTQTWRWIPSQVDDRGTTRHVSGFYVWQRVSAATSGPFPVTGYIPQFVLYGASQRADGGYMPDTNDIRHVVPSVSFPFVTADAYRACSTFSAAVPLDSDEVCFAFTWNGGEHRLRDGAQGFVGTTDEVPWVVPTGGYVDSGGSVVVVDTVAQNGDYTTLWASYFSSDPVINVGSDFAFDRRFPPPGPLPFTGQCDSAGLNDLASSTVEFYFEMEGGPSLAGHTAYLLYNVVAARPAPTTLFGLTFELSLANPFLGTMYGFGIVETLDAQGRSSVSTVSLSPVGLGLLDVYLGAEYLIVDPGGTQFVATTQAHWSKVGS
ncbi:MAG: hypothetical protein KDB80_14165, partial [Planctomycetes bacterium]|nr:hypothetical protein [Planctomycetota bacterium]